VALSHLAVEDVAERMCAVDTCADEPAGTGIGAYDGAEVAVDRFSIVRAALCGVHLASGGALDISDGVVAENGIGACVRGDYDVSRLTTGVIYRDNGVNLDSTVLPVPQPDTGVDVVDVR